MFAKRLVCSVALNPLSCSIKLNIKHKGLYTSFLRNYSAVDKLSEDVWDIVVSGGGMVGATMAATLGQNDLLKGKKILLLEGGEEKTYNSTPEGYSSRVVAINPSTVNLMQSIGAWEHILSLRYQEVKKMQVWDSCTDSLISFDKDNMQENLAYIVENDTIMAAVTNVLKQNDCNVTIKYKTRVKNYELPGTSNEQETHFAEIQLDDGQTILTKLLVGADGFKSLVRQTANIQTVQWDYDQMAVVATLKLSETTENNVAWQRFLKTGPIAMLPLSDDYSCLIWTTSKANAENLLLLNPENFVDAVNHAFWAEDSKDSFADTVLQSFDSLLGSIGQGSRVQHQLPPTVADIDKSSRAMFPLGLCHSTQYVKPRVALIGDAAHRVHPLAGQGVNLGFGDVACLRDKLVEALMKGSDIGSLTALLQYETERQRQVIPVMATIDGLNRLYSTAFTPVVLLRSLGLTATNAFRPLKDFIMKGAAT